MTLHVAALVVIECFVWFQCSNSEERYRNLHNEFIAYKEQHQYDNDEVRLNTLRLLAWKHLHSMYIGFKI